MPIRNARTTDSPDAAKSAEFVFRLVPRPAACALQLSVLAAALVSLIGFPAFADVSLPHMWTDHMVVQRDRPIHVWGRAEPGEHVKVTLAKDERETNADLLGRWSVYLDPLPAGGPFEMAVEGKNKLLLRDLMAGDVWIASGQSNMELQLRNVDDAEREIAAAGHGNIRFLRVKQRASAYPREDVVAAGWLRCAPETARDFSAVAYFFSRDLQRAVDVPIGLIDTSWGGTPLAAFTPMTAIGSDAALTPVFAQWGRMMNREETTLLEIDKETREYEANAKDLKAARKPVPPRKWHLDPESWAPAAIYNGMIAPLTGSPIRGVIWYQGESDANHERAPVYAHLFETMITSWRQAWNIGDFPFLFVQLPNFIAGPANAWPELREAQMQTLSVRRTGMAITLDIGTPENIHPPHKQQVGARLALLARSIAFGEKLEDSGPLFREAAPEGSKIRIWFDHTGNGLKAEGGSLRAFEVAGRDCKFVLAEAAISADGQSVVASSPAVPEPLYVRYAWTDNPPATLFNDKGLPASPFRSAD